MKGFFKDDRGLIHTTEWIIFFPFLVLIIFGGLSIGLGVWSKVIIADSAREAARYEALSLGDPRDKAMEVIEDGMLDTEQVESITVDATDDGYARVGIKYKYPCMFPFVSRIVGGDDDGNILIESRSVFKREIGL